MMGAFPEVVNLNRLPLQLSRFICSLRTVLPVHCVASPATALITPSLPFLRSGDCPGTAALEATPLPYYQLRMSLIPANHRGEPAVSYR